MNLAALNFKYRAGGRESTSSTGLLELRLGGAGTSLHLGTGGYRADLGTIAKTIGGRSDVLGVTRAKLAGEGSHALGVLNTSNYLAIGEMRQLSQEIWGRKVAVAFEDLGEDYGYYHHSENSNRIVINRRSNTNDREDVAVLAAGAAHEGQHRYDRTFHGRTSEYRAHRSGGAVYLNLMHGLGLKGNDRLMQSITAGLMSEQSKQRNTGPVDHWKLTADGGVAFTGEGWLQNEAGLYIGTDGSLSEEPIPGLTIGAEGIETGLLNILNDGGTSGRTYDEFNDTQKQTAQELMIGAGLGYVLRGDGTDTLANRFWNENTVDGQTIGAGMLAGYDLPGASNLGLLNGGLHRLFAGMGLGSVTDRVAEMGNGLEQTPGSIWDRIFAPGQQKRRGLFETIGNAWNSLWGNEPEIPDQTTIDRENVPISPGPLNPDKANFVLEYLTDDRIRNLDEAWNQYRQENGWSMSDYHCNEICIRDMLRDGLNPGLFDQDTPIPDAVAGYLMRGLTMDEPVQGTYGLIYYRRDGQNWSHVEQFRYEENGFVVYRTPGNDVAERTPMPWEQVGDEFYFDDYIFVPTGWLPGF